MDFSTIRNYFLLLRFAERIEGENGFSIPPFQYELDLYAQNFRGEKKN